MENLGELLEREYLARNTEFELSFDKPDPLFALRKNLNLPHSAEIALICALLSYGKASEIVKTLLKLDFSALDSEIRIKSAVFPKYRFQSSEDIRALFLGVHEIIGEGGIRDIFMKSYMRANDVICGIHALIATLRARILACGEMTRGLDFLIGRIEKNPKKSSPLKRWNMLLRWLVRRDNIDIGLWENEVKKSDLILPLDTHTFRLSKKLGLLSRKSYDLCSALEITENLKAFCPHDPVKYDFALYRLGQEKIL